MNGFKILELGDFQAELTEYWDKGAKPGVYLGFDCSKDFYSMRLGSVTDWTGLPQSGKTELLLEYLYNTSTFYGWKHLLYVPDIGDKIEIMAILIHKYTGKTFDRRYANHIELKEAFNACSWLLEHFKILEQVDPTAKITPMMFWQFSASLECHTATIDSWKDMYHPYDDFGGSYAKYLSYVLPMRNKLAEKYNKHFHQIIHPKNPRRDKSGKLIAPHFDDIEGGAQWNNSGKNIISVHRDNFETTIVDVTILKVKPRVVGKRGMFAMNFDPATSRYYETLMTGDRLYAHKLNTYSNIIPNGNNEFL
jgi:hypothetical protein